MGQLVVGRPAPRQYVAVSVPLELTSAISLTFRAGATIGESGEAPDYNPWLVEAWHCLDAGLRHDLELLLGFSGRLLYYIEELLFAFDSTASSHLEAGFDDYYRFLSSLPPEQFQQMATNSLVRIYRDRGLNETPPASDDPSEWRMFLRPGITRANIDEAAALVTSPSQLKLRTLALLEGFWNTCFEQEYTRAAPELRRAAQAAQGLAHPAVQVSFSELTGHRLPPAIDNALSLVDRVLYCPSAHLDNFIQYIFYPPVLILYFNARSVLDQRPSPARVLRGDAERLNLDEILDGLRALSDPSRMRIIEMLREGEMYAQEIVARLRISQSAVSRHLSTLESADIITVRPSNGMKYYAIDRARMHALAMHLESLTDAAQPTLAG